MTDMLWILALWLLAGQPAEPARMTVQRLWSEYAALATRNDAEALAEFFAADARLMVPEFDDVVGRLAIRASLKALAQAGLRPVDIRMMPREVTAYPGAIYDQGDFIQTVSLRNNPRGVADYYGRYFAVWVQDADGEWKLSRLMLAPKKQPA